MNFSALGEGWWNEVLISGMIGTQCFWCQHVTFFCIIYLYILGKKCIFANSLEMNSNY